MKKIIVFMKMCGAVNTSAAARLCPYSIEMLYSILFFCFLSLLLATCPRCGENDKIAFIYHLVAKFNYASADDDEKDA